MAPLENDKVVFHVCLAHTREWPEEVPQPRPDPFHRVAMLLADAVSVVVPRELASVMVHRRVPAVATARRVVPVPLVHVHHRTRLGGGQDRGANELGRNAPVALP